jgi:hypothetical protein
MAYSKEGNVFRPTLDGGSPKYWEQQWEGFKRIKAYREALVFAEKEKTLSAYEKTDPHTDAIAAHPGAVRILKAWGITVKRSFPDSEPVVLNKQGVYARSKDISLFGRNK